MKTFIVLFALVVGCLGDKTKHLKIRLARNTKIVAGEEAKDEEFPFQVSLYLNDLHCCGATVLSTEYVLTAAHCIYDDMLNKKEYTIKAGANNLKSEGSVHQVIESKSHEECNYSYPFNHNIAVLKVSPPLEMNSKVKPVNLPNENSEPAEKATGVAIGWGTNSSEPDSFEISNLQKVQVKILSLDECSSSFGEGLTKDMVCTGGLKENGGLCAGDSGGPLLLEGVQIGIASLVMLPCGSGLEVWTKVSHYRSWIKEKTGV